MSLCFQHWSWYSFPLLLLIWSQTDVDVCMFDGLVSISKPGINVNQPKHVQQCTYIWWITSSKVSQHITSSHIVFTTLSLFTFFIISQKWCLQDGFWEACKILLQSSSFSLDPILYLGSICEWIKRFVIELPPWFRPWNGKDIIYAINNA